MLDTVKFNSELSGLIGRQKADRQVMQVLLVDAMEFYRDRNHNTARLTKIVQSCVNVSSLPTTKIKGFIEHHCQVKWDTLKDGSKGYKKAKDGAVNLPAVNWWEWERPKAEVVEVVKPVAASPEPVTDEAPPPPAKGKKASKYDLFEDIAGLIDRATAHLEELNTAQFDALAMLEQLLKDRAA